MDYDSLVQAVIRSFHDVELRVELQPISQLEPKATRDSGTGPEPRPAATEGRNTGAVYKVHHCEVIPTSPVLPTKFLPQRPDVPNDEVTHRTSRPRDPFASSLRRYPSSEQSEVLERMVDYCPSRAGFQPHFPHSTQCRASDSSSRNTFESAASMPRAPEEHPTRDRRHKCTRHGNPRSSDGRRRENLKTIPSCTHAQKEAYTSVDESDVTTHTLSENTLTPTEQNTHKLSQPSVNTTVQATVPKMTREVETEPLPKRGRRTIAIPPPSIPSLGLSVTPDVDSSHNLTTRSVQTLNLPAKSVEIITRSTNLTKHKPVYVMTKKSKSLNDFRLNRDFKREILEWLDDINDPNIQKIQNIVTKNLTDRLKGIEMVDSERFKVRFGNCVKHSLIIGSKTQSTSKISESGTNTPNEANFEHITDQNNFEHVIKEWLSNISIKKRDIFLRPVKKDRIHNTFVNRLRHLMMEQFKWQSLREVIIEILNEVPIEVKSNEKIDYICTLTDALMYKLQNIPGVSTDVNLSPCRTTEKTRNDVIKEMKDNLRERELNSDAIKGLMIDLTDTLIDPSNLNIRLDDMNKLFPNTSKTSENEHSREISNDNHTDTVQVRPFTVPLTVFMVHEVPNTSKTLGSNISRDTIGFIEDKDIEANENQYKTNLANQINRWLSGLPILEILDKDLKQAAVLDFANDIVDRKKYLEFNDNSGSDIDELEHLKYLIFKWIKRTVGEENIDTIEHAPELMEMIRNIPVPIMTNNHLPKSNSGVSRRDSHSKPATMNINNSNKSTNNLISTTKLRDSKELKQTPSLPKQQATCNQRTSTSHDHDHDKCNRGCSKKLKKYWYKKPNESNDQDQSGQVKSEEYPNQDPGIPGPSRLMTPIPNSDQKTSSAAAKLMADWRPPPVFTPPPPGRPLLGQIHDEFQEYLKNWAQQIPIPDTTFDEAKIAEKARLGILKGIWKTITKIKTQPAVFQNQFYYEDVLGNEIDELFDCLPQTQELKDKRAMLKAQLLEKTAAMNDLVRDMEMPDNYKEIIAQKRMQLENEPVRKKVKLDAENPTKLFEKMLIYCILEDFLDAKNYKEDDPIKANAYKIKLLKNIQEYIDNLKTTHGKEIEDLFSVVKESDIMRVLSNVSLPSEKSITENRDEILIGLEVEQWMKDLPIVKNDDTAEQRHRTRLRDALIKKLHEIEKFKVANCCDDTQKRQEISFFLDKIPLEENQDLKINEMVEDLTTRLKKRFPADDKRKSVAFQNGHQTQFSNAADNGWPHEEDEDAQYRAIFKNNPLCSTRIELPSEEWAREEGRDAQYRAFFKDRPVSSSMIDQSVDYGAPTAPSLPDFYYPNEMEPYFVYAPGQYKESGRVGFFGYDHGVPQSDSRYRYPDQNGSMMPHEPQYHRYYDDGGIRRDASIPGNQHTMRQQDIPIDRNRSGVSAFEESGGFMSLIDHGPPDMYAPGHQKPQFHRPYMDPSRSIQGQGRERPNMLRPNEGEFVSMTSPKSPAQIIVPFDSPGRYQQETNQSNLSRDSRIGFSNRTNTSGMNNLEYPYATQQFQQPLEPINESSVSGAPSSLRQQNQAVKDDFVSMTIPKPPKLQVPSDSSDRNQPVKQLNMSRSFRTGDAVQHDFVSIPSHNCDKSPRAKRNASLDSSVRNQPAFNGLNMPRDSRIERGNQNPIENRTDPSQEARNKSIRNSSLRQSAPTNNLNSKATTRIPSISQQRDRLAPNMDPSEISNQPVGFSTPNQPTTNDVPPNIRERREMERLSGRPRASEEGEGEDRCHCLERFKRWNRDETNSCSVCDNCLNSGVPYLYSYPYPYPYPYPMQFRPQYPPHCKR